MLDTTTTDVLVIACVALGSVLWAFSPLAERFAGDQGAIAFLAGGVLLYVSGMAVVGWPHNPPSNEWVRYLPPLPLLWGWSTYNFFWFSRPDIPDKSEFPPEQHCKPQLEHGVGYAFAPYRKRTLRTRLEVRGAVSPSPCDLKTAVYAWGRAYYGFFYLTGKADLWPTVNIICGKESENACAAFAEVRGRSQITDGPVTLQVDHAVSPSAARVSVRTTVSASVGASGGPSIGVSGGGVSGNVAPVNSSRGFREEMGTFIWRCVPGASL